MNIHRGEMPRSFGEQAMELMCPLNGSQLTELIFRLGFDPSKIAPQYAPPIKFIEAIPTLCERNGISWNELFATIHVLLEPPRGRAYERFQRMRLNRPSSAVWEHAPVPRPTGPTSASGVHGRPTDETARGSQQEKPLGIRVLNALERTDKETVQWLMDVFLGEKESRYSKRLHLDGIAPLVSFVRLVEQRPGDLEQLWEFLKSQ